MYNYRLRSSIGIVTHENELEFFKSNTRDSLKIRINFPKILDLLKMFNGSNNFIDILNAFPNTNLTQLETLVAFLNQNNILIYENSPYPSDIYNKDYRLLNLLEDYCRSTSEVLSCLTKIHKSNVMIIGTGAVGSNIALQLSHSGIKNFIFVDHDIVDMSNLHRQYFFETDIGQKKAEALSNSLKKISSDTQVRIIDDKMNADFFKRNHIPKDIDVIINCADEPNVDYTSEIIANYCMKYKIPHIIGGGYNLHQTLIGQTVIPFETACFYCFKKYLDSLNQNELFQVRKLPRENRKLGSYPPLSGIAASLASLDALKLLIGKKETLQQTNKRIEFNLRSLSFNIQDVPRYVDCECCGNE